jgi:hypothetical protein
MGSTNYFQEDYCHHVPRVEMYAIFIGREIWNRKFVEIIHVLSRSLRKNSEYSFQTTENEHANYV